MEHAALKLTENQKAVLDFLKEHPKATLQNAADEVGLSLGGVKKIVAKLQEEDILYREGAKRSSVWWSRL